MDAASFQVSLDAQGGRRDPEDFSNIVVKLGGRDERVRLRDADRAGLGAGHWAMRSLLDNPPAGG